MGTTFPDQIAVDAAGLTPANERFCEDETRLPIGEIGATGTLGTVTRR